ncbi:MAG: GNAT family N-acetyltransferase [Sphingomonadales bacterium]|nr:GNAT family N-acetyltransferase [Sphingomonadales bacterium]MDE2568168.1 GNAT family N-acetyltransferase [Sphingomonadales bacterium]
MIAPTDDIDRMMAVMEAAFPPEYGEAWNRRQLADALVLGNCTYGLIAPDGSDPAGEGVAVVGFYLARSVLDERELLLFAIHPGHRRKGLGHALLRKFIDTARVDGMRRLFLEMRRGNPAGALYAAHGFRMVGLRPAYYRAANGSRLDAVSQELVLS